MTSAIDKGIIGILQDDANHIFHLAGNDPEKMRAYTKLEIDSMTAQDFLRIKNAIEHTRYQNDETRYFFSPPHVRAYTTTKMKQGLQKVTNWREAEQKGLLKYYFQGQGKWPMQPPHVDATLVAYSGDLDDYYVHRGILNWQQAVVANKIPQYMSGQGIYPNVEGGYECRYNGDYEEYIRSLSPEQMWEELQKYATKISPKLKKYDNATDFYETAAQQLERYMKVMVDLPEPVYIPGDGVGCGAMACRLLKKEYFASEPADMAKEAVWTQLIQVQEPYNEGRIIGMKSVFFGNNIEEIFPNEYDRYQELLKLKKKVIVAIVEEQGVKISELVEYSITGTHDIQLPVRNKNETITFPLDHKTVVLGKVKVRYQQIPKKMTFYAEVQSDVRWVPIDPVAESFLVYVDSLKWQKFKKVREPYFTGGKYDQKDKPRIFVDDMYVNDYVMFLHYVRWNWDKPKFQEYAKQRKIVWVSSKDMDIGNMDNILSMWTLSYYKDIVHGRPGDPKIKKGTLFFFSGSKHILDTGLANIGIHEYLGATVIDRYEIQGSEYVAVVKNPYGKLYVDIFGEKHRIVLTAYNERTSEARYRLAAQLQYGQEHSVHAGVLELEQDGDPGGD